MQIKELLELTTWIDSNIKSKGIAQNYQSLQSILKANTQGRQQQPFETQKNKLIESIQDIEVYGLTHEQEKMLDKMDILNTFGKSGVSNLENILFRNSLDIATASSELSKIHSRLQQAIQSSDGWKQHLDKYFPNEEDDDINDNEILMRVHFQKDVAISDVSKLEEFSKKWYMIGRGISMAHDKTPEDFKIVGAAKGSVIVEFALYAGMAMSVLKIMKSALQTAEQFLKTKKLLQDMELGGLNIEKTKNDIEKQLKDKKKDAIKEIVTELSDELNLSKENADGERITALEKSVQELINFIENGGEIDFYSPEKEDETKDVKKIKEKFEEIKQLESKLLAIELKK